MDITDGSLKAYFTTILAPNWHEAYARTPVVYTEIASLIPSTSAYSSYAWMGRLAKLREWIGERQHKNLESFPMTVKNKKFEGTVDISRDTFEDDGHGIYSMAASDLGEASNKYRDYLLRDLLEAGETTLCFDGQDFFSTAHPIDPYNSGAGTYSNLHTGTALTLENLAIEVAAFKAVKGSDGEKMGIKPTTLIVHPDQEHEANRILFANFLAETPAGGTMPVAVGASSNVAGRYGLKLMVWDDLTLSGKWYLGDFSKSVKPLVFQDRIAPDLVPLMDPSHPQVFERDIFSWGVRARGAATFSLPMLLRKMAA